MLAIVALVFLLVSAAVVLLVSATGGLAQQQHKLVLARLESINLAGRRCPQDEGLSLLREEMLSQVPVINRWLQRLDLLPGVRAVLSQSGMTWTLAGLLMKCAATAAPAGLAVYWRTRVWPLALGMALIAGASPYFYVLYRRGRRFGAFEQKLPEALDLIVRALRAGYGLMAAIEMAAKEMPEPIGGELRTCFDEQNFGLDFREAMLNLAARVRIHDVRLIVTAVLIQKESGGNLAEILDKVAYVIRERFRIKRQIRVHTAQGRLTGWILSLLPLVVGVGIYILNPNHMSRLWQHPTGVKLIYAAVVMVLVGGLCIRKIVQIRI